MSIQQQTIEEVTEILNCINDKWLGLFDSISFAVVHGLDFISGVI